MGIGSRVRTAKERFLFESSVRFVLFDLYYSVRSIRPVLFEPFFPIYSIRFVLLDWNRSNCFTWLTTLSTDLPTKFNNSLLIYRANGLVIGLATAS